MKKIVDGLAADWEGSGSASFTELYQEFHTAGAQLIESLEGISNFYTLHCPTEFQEDARAIFTAELILALKNRPKGRDSHIEGEILDDQLWIYQYGLPFNLNRAKNILPAFDILATALKARDAATETQ